MGTCFQVTHKNKFRNHVRSNLRARYHNLRMENAYSISILKCIRFHRVKSTHETVDVTTDRIMGADVSSSSNLGSDSPRISVIWLNIEKIKELPERKMGKYMKTKYPLNNLW